jgi:hypothetical protein
MESNRRMADGNLVFKPLDRMWSRIAMARDSSDTDFMLHLLYAGELLTKLVALGLIAGIHEDRERHRYRLLHRLVRADGLGDWSVAIDEVLSGPPAQHATPAMRQERIALMQRHSTDSWQYQAVHALASGLKRIQPELDALPTKLPATHWFQFFTRLRNRTRAHGALSPSQIAAIAPDLEEAIRLFSENFVLFQRPWAFLYRNLSGKYRVTPLTPETEVFNYLKSTREVGLENGVYVYFEEPHHVELIESSVEAEDFYIANGLFNPNSYESLSYITGDTRRSPSVKYMVPTGVSPQSGTVERV